MTFRSLPRSILDNIDDVDECLTESNELSLMGATVMLSRSSKSSMLALTVKVKLKSLKMTSSNAQNVVQHSYCLVALLIRWLNWT